MKLIHVHLLYICTYSTCRSNLSNIVWVHFKYLVCLTFKSRGYYSACHPRVIVAYGVAMISFSEKMCKLYTCIRWYFLYFRFLTQTLFISPRKCQYRVTHTKWRTPNVTIICKRSYQLTKRKLEQSRLWGGFVCFLFLFVCLCVCFLFFLVRLKRSSAIYFYFMFHWWCCLLVLYLFIYFTHHDFLMTFPQTSI